MLALDVEIQRKRLGVQRMVYSVTGCVLLIVVLSEIHQSLLVKHVFSVFSR